MIELMRKLVRSRFAGLQSHGGFFATIGVLKATTPPAPPA
jgi:hypothetical protein